jgi:hypothetical protein
MSSVLPLSGRRIAVTRARDQAPELAVKLTALGAEVIELPLISITKEVSNDALADVFLEFGSYDWLVFTSPNGVRYFFEEIRRIFDDIRSLGLIRFACIGEATAEAIRAFHLKIECQPKVATGAALADALIATGSLDSAKLIVVTGNMNRDDLVDKLEARPRDRGSVAGLQNGEDGPQRSIPWPRISASVGRMRSSLRVPRPCSPSSIRRRHSSSAKKAVRPLAGSIGPQTGATMKHAGHAGRFHRQDPQSRQLGGRAG